MTLTFIANMQFVAMIDQINEQLPPERQISLIGASLKAFTVIRHYRVMYPEGASFLMHEVLHTLGGIDAQIQQALGLPIGNGTENISKRCFDDCLKDFKFETL